MYYDVFTEIQLFSSFLRVCLNLNMPILSSSASISATWLGLVIEVEAKVEVIQYSLFNLKIYEYQIIVSAAVDMKLENLNTGRKLSLLTFKGQLLRVTTLTASLVHCIWATEQHSTSVVV